MEPIRCMIIDDEPLAVELIKRFVERTPYLQLEKCFTDSVEALEELKAHPYDPDVLKAAKRMGFSDKEIAVLWKTDEIEVFDYRTSECYYLQRSIPASSVKSSLAWIWFQRWCSTLFITLWWYCNGRWSSRQYDSCFWCELVYQYGNSKKEWGTWFGMPIFSRWISQLWQLQCYKHQ